MRVKTRTLVCGIGAMSLALMGACQGVEQPTPILTQAQWKQVQQHLLKAEPEPQHKLKVNYGDLIELIGMSVSGPMEAGKAVTITWYWRAKQDIKQDWRVFVHLDSQSDPSFRQNLDHHPVQDLFHTSKWTKDMIIEDVQQVTLREDWPKGPAIPYIGLYRGQERLPVKGESKHDGANRLIGPTLQIVGGREAAQGQGAQGQGAQGQGAGPRYTARYFPEEEVNITVDGGLDEPIWQRLPVMRLSGFQPDATYETWAKLFYTKDHLYIGAYLQDEHIWGSLTERDAKTWQEEVFEVFIDPNADGQDYLELQVTPRNVVFDARFEQMLGRGQGSAQEQIDRAKAFTVEGMVTAVKVEGTLNDASDKDTAWTIEIKLPFASLPGGGQPPKPGESWAVNLYRFDRPDQAKTDQRAWAWSTAANRSFHEVSKFGAVQFMASLPSMPTQPDVKMLNIDPSKLRPVGPIRKLDPALRAQDAQQKAPSP